MSLLLEDYLSVVQQYGINTAKDCTFSGTVTFSGTTNLAGVSLTNLTATGNTVLGNAVTDTTAITGATSITSTSASALVVGANGDTNPVLKVVASTASQATGIKIVGAAAAGGVDVTAISSGTNENLTINAKGSGTVSINPTGTGNISLGRATTVNGQFQANGPALLAASESIAAGGGANCYTSVGQGATAPRIVAGSGAPTIAAPKGSLYLRIDGSGVGDRMYVNTDASTTWTAVTTAA
jgi:hypothetical protein